MKTYHFNGENWYCRNWSLLHHIRYWFIWIGGWEKPNGTGWKFTYAPRKLSSPCPITLLGHRIVIYGLNWFEIRFGKNWLVFHFGNRHIYLSPDATPDNARVWLYGAPYEITSRAKVA